MCTFVEFVTHTHLYVCMRSIDVKTLTTLFN